MVVYLLFEIHRNSFQSENMKILEPSTPSPLSYPFQDSLILPPHFHYHPIYLPYHDFHSTPSRIYHSLHVLRLPFCSMTHITCNMMCYYYTLIDTLCYIIKSKYYLFLFNLFSPTRI